MSLLEVKTLTKRFGGLTALNEVSFAVEQGEIRGLIGPNGAGKSTMFKNIAGYYAPTTGDILLEGTSIAGKSPHAIADLGVVRTFQETTLFQELSVFDNVLVGCHRHARVNVFSALIGLARAVEARSRAAALEVIEFMGLAERRDQLARELPLGSQRALAMAIALATQPKLMLLDEPFAGMNLEETRHMMALTRKIVDAGITVILVEHDMKAVMGLCGYLTVLNFGSLLAEGTPEQVRVDERVIEAYLGGAG
ncbi:MAG: ABC transporter ATP-binding protein [Gammaproteobacteria bacterium]